MEETTCFPFLGGNIELVPAGEMDGINRETGQPAHFTWSSHVRVTAKGIKSKLNGPAIRAICDLYVDNTEFKNWVDSRC